MRRRDARSHSASIYCTAVSVIIAAGLACARCFTTGGLGLASSRRWASRLPEPAAARHPAPGREPTITTAGLDITFGRAIVVSLCAAGIATSLRSRSHKAGSQGAKSAHRVSCAAGTSASGGELGVILLSAGTGKRMGAQIPKQYLQLLGLEIALRSLDVFLKCEQVSEIVIVCAEEWRGVFQEHLSACNGERPVIKFAPGGTERQDSVSNGLSCLTTEFAAIHDAARPLVTVAEFDKVVADAKKYGAAVLAVPTKATIKQSSGSEEEPRVSATPDRKTLWEAHTPQVIRTELLRQGFANAKEKSLAVTDDVSLVEYLGQFVKLTKGEYTNIKVTTPEDIAVAETILKSREAASS